MQEAQCDSEQVYQLASWFSLYTLDCAWKSHEDEPDKQSKPEIEGRWMLVSMQASLRHCLSPHLGRRQHQLTMRVEETPRRPPSMCPPYSIYEHGMRAEVAAGDSRAALVGLHSCGKLVHLK